MARGVPPAKALPLNNRQLNILKKEKNRRNIPAQLKTRIAIIVLSSGGQSISGVASTLGLSINGVKLWRKRWLAHYESLCAFELGPSGEGVSDRQLRQKMITLLSDKPRSGAPKRITLEQEEQIIALACEKPAKYGIEMTQWNREMLTQVVIEQGIIETISARHVSNILKKKSCSLTNQGTGSTPKSAIGKPSLHV